MLELGDAVIVAVRPAYSVCLFSLFNGNSVNTDESGSEGSSSAALFMSDLFLSSGLDVSVASKQQNEVMKDDKHDVDDNGNDEYVAKRLMFVMTMIKNF